MSEPDLRLLTAAQLGEVYRRRMREDFPPDELKPLSVIRRHVEKGRYDPYGVFRGDTLLGYAFLWKGGSPFSLLDYFAVAPEERNRGLGQAVLEELAARLCRDGGGFLCEAEAPVSGCGPTDSLRQRRLNFYLRSGGRLAGYGARVFGVPYRVLSWGPPITDAELMEYHRQIYRNSLPKLMYEQQIVIPEVFS